MILQAGNRAVWAERPPPVGPETEAPPLAEVAQIDRTVRLLEDQRAGMSPSQAACRDSRRGFGNALGQM